MTDMESRFTKTVDVKYTISSDTMGEMFLALHPQARKEQREKAYNALMRDVGNQIRETAGQQ